jgi:hypothetical protein
LQDEFNTVGGPAFHHPLVNLAEAALLMQALPNTPYNRQIQFLAKEALYQMDKNEPLHSLSRHSHTPVRQRGEQEAN